MAPCNILSAMQSANSYLSKFSRMPQHHSVALNYYQKLPQIADKGYGRVARYAWGRDYHKLLTSKLRRVVRQLQRIYPREQFRLGVDAIPLAERHYARQGGLGFIGANTTLISPVYGSCWLSAKSSLHDYYRLACLAAAPVVLTAAVV